MLFKDDVGDHDVADAAVQGGRLAEHVDAAQRPHTDRNLAENVVCAEAQRVVDIDQNRGAAFQAIGGRIAESRVEIARHQPIQNDDLRGNVKAGVARKEEDAAGLLFAGPLRPPLSGFGGLAIVRPGRVIEEVVPVATRLPLAELAQLRDQLEVIAALDVIDDFLLVPSRRATQQVDEAMGIARYEIDRTVANPLTLHQRLDRRPPPACRLDVADLRTAEHPNGEVFLVRLDAAQWTQQVGPNLDESDRVVLGDSKPLENLELLRDGL